MLYKEDCFDCVFLNHNGTCGNKRSIMFNIATNERTAQLCSDRRYYDKGAFKKYRKRRKIETIYNYE